MHTHINVTFALSKSRHTHKQCTDIGRQKVDPTLPHTRTHTDTYTHTHNGAHIYTNAHAKFDTHPNALAHN